MPWLVDGSNVLGAMRVDRHSDDSKRGLVRLLAGFARAKKTRVICVFDGELPASFGLQLGAVTVLFSGRGSADDLIAGRAAAGRGWNVVTSDRGLATRVQRRQVKVVEPGLFLRDLEAMGNEGSDPADDWTAYFSDEKNRLKF